MGANPHANGGAAAAPISSCPTSATTPSRCRLRRRPVSEATRVLGAFSARRHACERRPLPGHGPRRDRLQPARSAVRGHRPRVGRRAPPRRRPPAARRARDGGPQRAPLPGLARGLPADRPPRPVQLLRGLHPHRRLDVQPAREVAEGHARDPVAAADRLAQLPAVLARLAPGPQRLLPPGPGLHRPRRQQEGRGRPRLSAARRQLPAVGRRPLPAQPRLRQRDRGRQAAGARLPDDGGGGRPLHARASASGSGPEQRRRARARRRAGLRRATSRRSRRSPPRRSCAERLPAPARAGGQRRRPDAPAPGQRAPARPARQRVRRPVHELATGRSSPTTATRG